MSVIVNFGDRRTKDIFDGTDSKEARSVSKALWPVAHRKLDMLNAAHDLLDLRVPPGNKLEKLRGDLAGFLSIRITDQFRVIFRFADGNASDVRIADYH